MWGCKLDHTFDWDLEDCVLALQQTIHSMFYGLGVFWNAQKSKFSNVQENYTITKCSSQSFRWCKRIENLSSYAKVIVVWSFFQTGKTSIVKGEVENPEDDTWKHRHDTWQWHKMTHDSGSMIWLCRWCGSS